MDNLQITLTILLLIIEVAAFAWLIIDIQKSKKKQDKIIELERRDHREIAIRPHPHEFYLYFDV